MVATVELQGGLAVQDKEHPLATLAKQADIYELAAAEVASRIVIFLAVLAALAAAVKAVTISTAGKQAAQSTQAAAREQVLRIRQAAPALWLLEMRGNDI